MNNATDQSPLTKREFYDQSRVAQTYDELRFGGDSGAWVNEREISLALSLVPPPGPATRGGGRVLDLGCGTGRLTRALAKRSRAVGMDAASAMLAVAREQNTSAPTLGCGADFIQGDAFSLPFASASFDAVVALRLVFHFARLDALLKEMCRVAAPGGVLVFDTYLWSPRALMPLDRQRWGTQIYVHNPRAVDECARALGLCVMARTPAFLFSPYLYRRLPIRIVRMLARLETHLPERLHARVFWKIERP
jgi:ubiquinone/menaquinone biosynthesis C-methylase UbiE